MRYLSSQKRVYAGGTQAALTIKENVFICKLNPVLSVKSEIQRAAGATPRKQLLFWIVDKEPDPVEKKSHRSDPSSPPS